MKQYLRTQRSGAQTRQTRIHGKHICSATEAIPYTINLEKLPVAGANDARWFEEKPEGAITGDKPFIK